MPVLSLSHVCVTHVGRPRAGGRAYMRAYRGWYMRGTSFCVCIHEGTSEGTKEGRGGRTAMTTMGRWVLSALLVLSLRPRGEHLVLPLGFFVGSLVPPSARSLARWYDRSFPLFHLRANVVFPRSFRPGWCSPRHTGGYSFRSCAHAGIPHRQKQRYSSPPPFQHRSASSSSLPCIRYHSPPSPSLAPHPPLVLVSLSPALDPLPLVLLISSSIPRVSLCFLSRFSLYPFIFEFPPSKISNFPVFITSKLFFYFRNFILNHYSTPMARTRKEMFCSTFSAG